METKPFKIGKWEIEQAWEQVKAKKGAAGVDGVTLERYEKYLGDNLYKVWNRMSSGSYFPQPVRRVEIPKLDGGTRPLGIPTVEDRICQQVVKNRMEQELEPIFHEDSYGYRPGKSAHQAVKKCQERIYKTYWVLDLDVSKYFDSIDHEKLMRAVRKHVKERWMLLYIERWLRAPIQYADGKQEESRQGTPQGGVISPILANLYLHYTFDIWMNKHFPLLKFERYADDMVIHCFSRKQCEYLKVCLEKRFRECGLILHPEKTKIVYCQQTNRTPQKGENSFKFLGFLFKPRRCKSKTGAIFSSFRAGVSPGSMMKVKDKIREERIHSRQSATMFDLARDLNPIIKGWLNYYAIISRHGINSFRRWMDFHLAKWIRKKHRLNTLRQAQERLLRIQRSQPGLFMHWQNNSTN